MMVLGTIGAFGFEDFDPPEMLALYAGAGCKVVQAYRNRQKDINAAEIRSVCDDLGLKIDSLHAHFGNDLDPSCEDEHARSAAVAFYETEAEYCRSLGGDLVVIHPSPPRATIGDINIRRDHLRKSMREFARLGEKTGVRFAFENMPSYHPIGSDVKRLVDDIAAVDSEHLVFLLDIAHAHMTCGAPIAVRIAGRHLRYTHACDNDGLNDTHLLPFSGNLPWDECAAALHGVRYDGVFLLEVFQTADTLRRLLTDEWKNRMERLLTGDNAI